MSNININFEKNGKIFPSWVMYNFKQFILPKIIIKDGVDPCNLKNEDDLTLYQQFIGEYLNYQSQFIDILLYHGVGSGKTRTVINLYNIIYNFTSEINIYLLIPASLHQDPWMKELKLWLKKEDFDNRLSKINFIHYDAPNADKKFLEAIKKNDVNKQSIFIIEEVHRFINNVYNNISSNSGKKAQTIYNYIINQKINNHNTRIILLSATPLVNKPFEFALLFNLLRPDSFPSSERLFEELFESSNEKNNKNMFQRRILGLVSYYVGATPDKYAKKKFHSINIPMDKYQENIYKIYEDIELKKEKMRIKMNRGKINNNKDSTYLSYTRQTCNFVFPHISDKINGETRPRPSMFKLKYNDIKLLDENIINDETAKKNELNEYMNSIDIFIKSLIKYLVNIKKSDNNHTIYDDIKSYETQYNYDFDNFYKSSKKKSNLFNELYKLSPKFIKIIFNIKSSKGTVMIYSNYVLMEGLQIFKIYLELFGFININSDTSLDKNKLNPSIKLNTDYLRYCEFHGKINKDVRTENKTIFNNEKNKYGKYCKIIMISPAGSEGITLSNVRQVHIIEPYWNEVRIEQVIGRAVRFCQHKDLPLDERIVDIYRYKMTRNNNNETTDEKIEELARNKHNILLNFLNLVKEAAVDCELFKNHNMINTKYNCFNFSQEALLDNSLTPAFNKNLLIDKKLSDGLNAVNSQVKTIKVYKILAVKLLNINVYSKEEPYWFDYDSGIIYDYHLNSPIGKILKFDNNYKMIGVGIYIIDTSISYI